MYNFLPRDIPPLICSRGNILRSPSLIQVARIPEGSLDRFFDPYFTTKEKGHQDWGSATSYSIISNHNGQIQVSSELGKGSTFRIYLPASEQIPQSDSIKAAVLGVIAERPGVLVMDDEDIVLDLAKRFITTLRA